MSIKNSTFDNTSIPKTLSQTIYNYLKDALDRSIQEHKKILRALEDKDKRALKSLVKSNWSLLLDKKLQKSGKKGF